ncbi:hypothetical protein ACLMJK_001157 [Lecanora helva]
MASSADPLDQPIAPPPPGVTPNLDHPAWRSCGVVPVTVVFLSLSTIFLLLRLYTKLRIIKIFGLEDLQQNYGNGRHLWEIKLRDYIQFGKWGAPNVVIYIPAAGLAKVAILLFYLRINPDRNFRFAVFGVLFVTISYMVAMVLALIFQCDPISGFWDVQVHLTAKCVSTAKLYLANSILNVLTDFMVLLLPIPMLVALQVGLKQKVLIWSAFAAGSLTAILSTVRAYYISRLIHSTDPTWTVQLPTVLTTVETNLTIICSAVMLLRPLIRRHFPSVFSNFSKGASLGLKGKSSGNSSGKKKQTSGSGSRGYEIFGDSVVAGKGSNRAQAEGYGLDTLDEGRTKTGASSRVTKMKGAGSSGDSDITAVEEGLGPGGKAGRSWFDMEFGRGKSESEERIVEDKV